MRKALLPESLINKLDEFQKYEALIFYGKFLYYYGYKVGLYSPLSDQEYDEIESKYISICEEDNKEPHLKNMVGFNFKLIESSNNKYFWWTIYLLSENNELNNRIKNNKLII